MATNHLANETSPYLLQHAHNPVDWYPWGEEALTLARENGKPILLSIGYAACHWCHVMERESFEDESIAAYMNEHFVCVKIDREERPDLDKIYQITHQILSQRPGGWPLTVAIDPVHHAPFFAGTYFPDQSRHGMPSFPDVLRRIVAFYVDNRDGKLPAHANAVKSALSQLNSTESGEPVPAILDDAARELESAYDPDNGGFGGAPKFPHPTNINLCLRLWERARADGKPEPALLDIAVHSLQAMGTRGLFDHVGGGFYRYAVDAGWTIPHFEKMLYDNAQLFPLYVDAFLITGESVFRDIAVRTGRWVMSEMQSGDGAYFSTLDADSQGEEGRYYVWTADQLSSVLDDGEWPVVAARYGLHGSPNFEGKWHLNIESDLTAVCEQTGFDHATAEALLDSALTKLHDERSRRQPPLRDEKILTAWNGLMIRAMVHAGTHLAMPEFVESANRALEFVRHTLWRQGRLSATTRDGVTRLNAYLDDYVFLIDALLAMNTHSWSNARIIWAVELADAVIEHFEDRSSGGMFFTSDDHESLLHRDKPSMDDATPSGNGVATRVLLRLGHLLGETRFLDAARRIVESMSGIMRRHPSAHGALMEALCEYHEPVETIIIRGRADASAEWKSLCSGYAPGRQLFAIPEQTPGELPGIIENMSIRGDVTAYVCRGTQCSDPITDRTAFKNALG